MPLIDTHAHLFDDRLLPELPAVLDRAGVAGIERVICIGIDRASSEESVRLAQLHARVVAAVGIQPNHVAEALPGDWDAIVQLAESAQRIVAIGETGLDRHWDKTPFAQQEDYFARHIELARRLNRPFIVHCREAEADVVRVLREQFTTGGPVPGVMHSFSGDLATAQECLAMGLYVSFAGMLTYPSAAALREVAARVPLERLLVETDCPYLSPVPHRGKRNEPAYVAHTAATLAACQGVSPERLAEQTTQNARTLFSI